MLQKETLEEEDIEALGAQIAQVDANPNDAGKSILTSTRS